jgi:hypothetical protein
VRERQLKAAAADINRHRAAAASAAAFQKRGPGPISTMQMTTGRNGSSPPRQPVRPPQAPDRQRDQATGAAQERRLLLGPAGCTEHQAAARRTAWPPG